MKTIFSLCIIGTLCCSYVSAFSFSSSVSLASLSKSVQDVGLQWSKLTSDLLSSTSSVEGNDLGTTLATQPDLIKVMETLHINPDLLSQQGLWDLANSVAADYRTLPAVTLATFIAVLGGWGQDDAKIGSPYEAGSTSYSKQKADLFFSARPLYVFRRLLKLGQITGAFNFKLFLDWRLNNLEANEKERAKEALVLATQMGPTFIKLGQALSLRLDLIPEAYALELRQLQDAVPPFETPEAYAIIAKELNISYDPNNLSNPFQGSEIKFISRKPIASASIGQVYKATLKDGREVAIKVQRPNILADIALDLYLLRLLTPIQVRISNAVNKLQTSQADIDVALTLVDEWGRGFVNEVDYLAEARNTEVFRSAMQSRALNAVTAPQVVNELSTNRVLVTEWVEGTRLDLDASPDVPRLCAVAVNAYLTMLLDTGTLHCDPHPGNLLRTTDGKLCVLDWGMTLDVPKDLQYSLLEFIAHVNTEAYDQLPDDFVNLGFSPANQIDKLKNSGMTESLAFTFRQLQKGGGAQKIRERLGDEFRQRYGEDKTDDEIRKLARAEMMERMEEQLKSEGIDVNGVTDVMEKMSRRNRDLFKLPPYVLYVSRAFSTLEGIGLQVSDEYSILQECYPYLARRLMSDNSPRAQRAFRTMVFGSPSNSSPSIARGDTTTQSLLANAMSANMGSINSNSNPGAGGSTLSANKLFEMTSNFASYTASTSTVGNEEGIKEAQKALVDLIFTLDDNHVQNILLEGCSRTADSLIRESYSQAKESLPGQALRTLIKGPKTFAEFIPMPLKGLTAPLTAPYEIAKGVDILLRKEAEDESMVATIKSLLSAPDNLNDTSSPSSSALMGMPPAAIERQEGVSDEARQQALQILQEQLSDPSSVLRSALTPAVVAKLSRKLGGSLLLRASERLESTHYSLQTYENEESGMNAVDVSKSIASSASNISRQLAKNLAPELVTMEEGGN